MFNSMLFTGCIELIQNICVTLFIESTYEIVCLKIFSYLQFYLVLLFYHEVHIIFINELSNKLGSTRHD